MFIYMIEFDYEVNKKYWKNELLYRRCRIKAETSTQMFIELDHRPKFVDGGLLQLAFNSRTFELDNVLLYAPAHKI